MPNVDLILRAIDLYPANVYLQREWVRAIEVVRSTGVGWVLDAPRPIPLEVHVIPHVIRLQATA